MLSGSSIAVLGSGVIGLTTALVLRRRGVDAVVYGDRAAHPAASTVAPALFTPYPGAEESRLRRWLADSLREFGVLAAGHDESGVTLAPLHEYYYKGRSAPLWIDELLGTTHLAPPPGEPRITDVVTSIRPHVDMTRYLPWLERTFKDLGGRIVTRSIRSFSELFDIGHATIVNCSGLGAAALADDRLVRPMRGQVLHVVNDIGLTHSVHDDAPGDLVSYVFTFRDHLVLGGTFEADTVEQTTNQTDLDLIVARCRNLLRIDGHPRWKSLGSVELRRAAAARPTRTGPGTFENIRLEIDASRPSGRSIIHNYGHGRSGVTLSWGCAIDAATLAQACQAP